MAGYDLNQGKLRPNNVSTEDYWALFNHFFSNSSRNTSSYKFGFIKAILDNLLSTVKTPMGMELSFDDLFVKFAQNYWNLVAKYHIRQMRYNGKASISKLEAIIETVAGHSPGINQLEFEELSAEDQDTLVSNVKNDCRRYVIGAAYSDFDGSLFGFNKSEEKIWLHIGAYQFLMSYKTEIEQLNYYSWAKFLEQTNKDDAAIGLIGKLELSTPRRKNLSIYREILREEFETNTCFYCGCKLGNNSHVDHVLPWSFVKSDHLWNFVLTCSKCNLKKKDHLPERTLLAGVINRNGVMKESSNSFIINEFKGYEKELMWNIWDYASRQGYTVYEL